jgi:hypothetical protein
MCPVIIGLIPLAALKLDGGRKMDPALAWNV